MNTCSPYNVVSRLPELQRRPTCSRTAALPCTGVVSLLDSDGTSLSLRQAGSADKDIVVAFELNELWRANRGSTFVMFLGYPIDSVFQHAVQLQRHL
jgi:hypothetical protein